MTTALEGDERSASRPGRSLPPGKTRYPLYKRLGGPQGRSGQVRKISPTPPPGFDPRTVQPVASRYTDYASRPTEMTVPAEYALSRHCKQSLVLGVLGVTHDQSAWIVCPPEDSKQTGTVEAAGLGVKKYYEMPWN